MKLFPVTLTSTAETRTEKRAPVFSFLSLMSLNSQEMAQGIIPRVCRESSRPIIVYDLPGRDRQKDERGEGWTWKDGVISKRKSSKDPVNQSVLGASRSAPLRHDLIIPLSTLSLMLTHLCFLSGVGDQTHNHTKPYVMTNNHSYMSTYTETGHIKSLSVVMQGGEMCPDLFRGKTEGMLSTTL